MSRVVRVNSGLSKFIQKISIGTHALLADESSEHGGRDAGADPEELLLAALGACASITVQMYADRKGWPVTAVNVQLSYVTIPPENGAAADRGTTNSIEMEISFSGDLSDDQRNRLFEIAERCPVHRMLTSEMKIHTKQTTLITTNS